MSSLELAPTTTSGVRILHHQAGNGVMIPLDTLDQARVEEARDNGDFVWIDLLAPDRAQVAELAERFGWDRITVEDVFDDRHLAKFSDYTEYLFIVLNSLGPPGRRIGAVEVNAYLTDACLVTIRHEPVPPLEELIEACQRSPGLSEGGADRMLARVAAAVVAPFFPLIDTLEDRIEGLEDLAIERNPAVIGEVQVLRSDVTRLRRFVAPQRDVMMALSRPQSTPLIGSRARLRFADTYEHVYRIVEALDGERLLLAAVLETYRSAVAEEMNQVMKVLTVFSAIILPLTLLTGIWGMNFENMPELTWTWGYFAALGLIATAGIGMWLWFVRKRFIGGPRLRHLPKAIGIGLFEVATLPVRGFAAVVRALLTGDKNRPYGH